MKRKGKSVFFIVAAFILAFSYVTFFGLKTGSGDSEKIWFKSRSDIRFGIDIRGGVEATFVPADGETASEEDLQAAEAIMKLRLVNLNITDYEIYTDTNKGRIIVRFPWKEDETNFNPEDAINEIGANAYLTFRDGISVDEDKTPNGEIVITGSDVESASAVAYKDNTSGAYKYGVNLKLTAEGSEKFAEATKKLKGQIISIWMDNTLISYPTVDEEITDGQAQITGNFTAESAQSLANNINAGSLPFTLSADSYSTISPTLGASSLEAMVKAGIIAFILVAAYIIILYRLPGVIASIALLGQVCATIACVSGLFPDSNSFTLTLPGIAGIILAIGMGVDANIITAERIKEELNSGMDLDSAISAGFSRGLTPIVDGNITILIIAVLLMGSFGPTDSIFAKILKPIFFAFGVATAGTIYSFGYTLLVGVVFNFVFGIVAARLMLRSVSKFNRFRNKKFYGYSENPKPLPHIDFIGNKKKYFTFSAVLMVAIAAASFVINTKLDIRFTGGALLTYGYEGEISDADIEKDINDILGKNATVTTGENSVTGNTTFTVSMPGQDNVSSEELEHLSTMFGEKYAGNNIQQLEVNNVNAAMGSEFFAKCMVALVAAAVIILIYIAIRFKNIGGLPAGAMAIVALMHDLVVIFGVFVICKFTINGNFVAAMLTILGYSINDTVVVYDRIRENKNAHSTMKFTDLVNMSINQSLIRSINTTVSTVLALGVVCVIAMAYGLNSILTFAFPMAIGMISGVYSTICIAGPLWVAYEERKNKKA